MDITVTGTGRFSQPPELATLTLVASVASADKVEALTATTQLVNDLTARIRDLSDLDSSPITWSAVLPIQTHSWRPYSDRGEPMPVEHSASARLLVKFRDFGALARFVDDVGGLAGLTVSEVDWALTPQTQERTEAAVLAQAVARAKSRATTIAHAAGALDLQFRDIADPGLLGEVREAAPKMFAASARADMGSLGDGGIDLAPEDIVVTATLHARFEAT